MKYGSEWEREWGPRYGWKGLKDPPAGPAFVLADTFTPAGHKGFGDTSRIHSPHLTTPSQSCLALLALLYSALRFVCPRSVVLYVITITSFVQPVLRSRVFRTCLCLAFASVVADFLRLWLCWWPNRWFCVCIEYRTFQTRLCIFWNVFLCFVKVVEIISLVTLVVIIVTIYRR